MTHDSLDTTKKLTPHTRSLGMRVLRIAGISVLALVAFVVLAITGLTWYLSGPRLTELVNSRASEYFKADIRTKNCNFTIWSTFPRFCVNIDSLQIVSRTLNGRLSQSEKELLPRGADSLASLKSMRGAVNVLALMTGKIELHDVKADGLRLNLVAVNDSVNNFNIIPQTDSIPFKMPYMSANSISLNRVEELKFYSLPENMSADVNVKGAELQRRGKTDTYKLQLQGDVSATLDSIHLCHNLPFMFGGDVKFGFNPFAVTLDQMRVKLANMDSRVSMGLNLGERSGIDDFRTEISTFDIMKLLAYLPAQFLPDLQGLSTDLRTRLSIRLTAPYHFSEAGLPSFVAQLIIPSSTLTYTLTSGEKYTLRDITLRASLNFNGKQWQSSNCDIEELKAVGEGFSLLLNGNIAEVFTNPQLASNIHLDVDIPRLASAVPQIAVYKPSGELVCDASVDFPVSLLTADSYIHIPIRGTAIGDNLALTIPGGTAINTSHADIVFDNKAGQMLQANSTVRVKDIAVTMPGGMTLNAPKLNVNAEAIGGLVNIAAAIPNVGFKDKSKNLSVDATDVDATYSGTDVKLNMQNLKLLSAVTNVNLKGLSASVNPDISNLSLQLEAQQASGQMSGGKTVKASDIKVNAKDLSDIHVGSYLLEWRMPDFDAPGRLFKASALQWRGGLALTQDYKLKHVSLFIPKAMVSTAVYDAPVSISNLRADMAGLDSITLHSLRLRSQMTGVDLAGGVKIGKDSIGRLMLSGQTKIHFDTLHFNQIARTIEHGSLYHGNRPGVDPKDPAAAPRVYGPMMVSPRFNLKADITADATVYTNLWLTNLGAHLSMTPGRLAIDTLYLSANFGHAQASAEYVTPDKENMALNVGLHMQDFDLTEFFQSYPKVLAMMPEMSNLHGIFHADGYIHTGIFPNMGINTPSMIADFSASATQMYLHQNHFIHRIARMALIFEDGNINIPTIHARARIYDHLLTVEPFDIHIGKYLLQVAGRNDFSGNLYYHVGVLHNPLIPIKFGIDIRGKYHHPLIRFADSEFNIGRSEKINGVDADFNINLIDELHHGGLLLLHHAAKAEILNSDPTK